VAFLDDDFVSGKIAYVGNISHAGFEVFSHHAGVADDHGRGCATRHQTGVSGGGLTQLRNELAGRDLELVDQFDHQIRQTGAKLVEVETREEMIAAINPKTVAIHFTNILSDNGKISGPETVAIAKAHNIYTFNDAAADVPPKERLWEYPAIGFDMVTFSGGKDIRGPQASGILIGKGRADPLLPAEYEPSGRSHRPLLQGGQGDHCRFAQGA
jgi:hypothetical protein